MAGSVPAGGFLLHAALLTSGRKGLLLVGPPGAGKSTLTLALAARGLGYGSDDIVRVSATGTFSGVRFSPALKSGSWELAAVCAPQVSMLPVHLRSDGQQVRYVPAGRLPSGDTDAIGWSLQLARRPGARAALEPIEPVEMITSLLAGAWSATYALRGDTLAALAHAFADVACHRLVYSDLDEAAELLMEHMRG